MTFAEAPAQLRTFEAPALLSHGMKYNCDGVYINFILHLSLNLFLEIMGKKLFFSFFFFLYLFLLFSFSISIQKFSNQTTENTYLEIIFLFLNQPNNM